MDTSQTTGNPFWDTQPSQSAPPMDTSQTTGNPFWDTPNDVSSAQKQLGSTDKNGLCEAFVEQVTGKPNMGGSAAEAWNNYTKQGEATPGLDGIKPGDIIYFAPDSSNAGYGHTGIYQGNNHFISATYNGVQTSNLADWQKQTGQQVLGYVPQK